MEPMFNPDIILALIGGLAIFLYRLDVLAHALKQLSQKTMKRLLLRFSRTPARGIATGAVATTVLDSSSVTIILLIAFVDAGLLSFTHGMGIVLGANIGTTISSQIIAFKIGDYAAIGLMVGVMGDLMLDKGKWQYYFRALIGFSLIFYGLHLMDLAVYPYRDSELFRGWMATLDNPLYGVLAGALTTLVIQSSSATIGMAIVLASQGLLSLEGGIAVMLGAEIGTCSDTLIATIGRSREAVKLGMFHLLFNVASVTIGLLLFDFLRETTVTIAPDASIERQIANAHVLFNVAGVLLAYLLILLFRFRGWTIHDQR